MTKEQYEDFRLMLKSCGAGLPMYSTLNRFERVWFSSIIEILTEKDKEIEELHKELADYQFNYPTIKELEAQIEQLKKINNEQKETLKKVRVALIQERTANIMNYGKGGVEMFDSMFEILKGVSN